jgi:hypothetical protein
LARKYNRVIQTVAAIIVVTVAGLSHLGVKLPVEKGRRWARRPDFIFSA